MISGKLPRVNTGQKCWGIRKTSSSSTSTNCMCDGSEADNRWKRLEGRLKATAKTLKLLTRTVLSHFCFLKNKKYIQARLGNFSLFLIPPTLPANIPYSPGIWNFSNTRLPPDLLSQTPVLSCSCQLLLPNLEENQWSPSCVAFQWHQEETHIY